MITLSNGCHAMLEVTATEQCNQGNQQYYGMNGGLVSIKRKNNTENIAYIKFHSLCVKRFSALFSIKHLKILQNN